MIFFLKPPVMLGCSNPVSYASIKWSKVLNAVNANGLQIDYTACHIESEARMWTILQVKPSPSKNETSSKYVVILPIKIQFVPRRKHITSALQSTTG
jgi:hypothetical protein